MSRYTTASQMLTRYGATEIAQRADRDVPRVVTAEVLLAVAETADLSNFTDEEIARTGVAMIVVDRALKDADNTIDGYIGGRYSLPLSSVPDVLDRIACDLARYYLFDDQVTQPIKDRYDDCIRLLKDVQAGRVQLGPDTETGVDPTSTGAPELVSGAKVWDREASRGFL